MKIGITVIPRTAVAELWARNSGLSWPSVAMKCIHRLSAAHPLEHQEPRTFFHEVTVSQYPLFEYPPYDLALATRMAEVAEIYNLDILHVHYAIPHSVSALLARQMLAAQPNGKSRKAPICDHPARHRHHDCGRGSILSAGDALRD